MNIKLILTGQTDIPYVQDAITDYTKRLSHYVKFETIVINPPKNSSKQTESELIMKYLSKELKNGARLVLLDERGKEFRSVEFADYLQRMMNQSVKTLIFVIGGAFGFGEAVYDVANERLSLSKMTFSHQLIRILFVEQLYRAFTILKNEPYHNE
ncbi:MAG: 23S rRNA (pseudouridine(1915)-N(3))-methyltransferase RlmH [Bacteroidales bacterium]|nr:23S rRNA (pseudouridine(1915)-N(3))-methyltransferase RlmH [Bacteroidales bacterium]